MKFIMMFFKKINFKDLTPRHIQVIVQKNLGCLIISCLQKFSKFIFKFLGCDKSECKNCSKIPILFFRNFFKSIFAHFSASIIVSILQVYPEFFKSSNVFQFFNSFPRFLSIFASVFCFFLFQVCYNFCASLITIIFAIFWNIFASFCKFFCIFF